MLRSLPLILLLAASGTTAFAQGTYLPVAEGNHWQWELATGAVGEAVMPAHMTDRIPHRELMLSYAQLLFELDLL